MFIIFLDSLLVSWCIGALDITGLPLLGVAGRVLQLAEWMFQSWFWQRRLEPAGLVRDGLLWLDQVATDIEECSCPWQELCHKWGNLHLLKRWRELRYSVDQRFQKCCVNAWQSRHRLSTGMGVTETWSGNDSRGQPIRKWPGVRGANLLSSFASSAVNRGLELRQASIWHSTVVISSKVSLLSPTIRFKWRLQALTLFSQTEPWWGPVGGLNFHWILWLLKKFIIDFWVVCSLRRHDSSLKSLFARWKQDALSLHIWLGFPLREIKRRRAARKASAVRSETSWMWQDSVARQTKMAA